MVRRLRSQILGFSLLLAGAGPLAAQVKVARWMTDTLEPCASLAVGWWVDAPKLQALVGTRDSVTTRPDGKGLVVIDVATCHHSTIDGINTGPVAIGVVLVRVHPPADSTRLSSVPLAYGPAAAPVTELFKRYGFATGTGPVSLQGDSSGMQRRARFVIETADGKLEAKARLGDSISHYAFTGRSLSSGVAGTFAGPEWGDRRHGTATVQATGATILSRLGITAPPDLVAYDTNFGWNFTFNHDR